MKRLVDKADPTVLLLAEDRVDEAEDRFCPAANVVVAPNEDCCEEAVEDGKPCPCKEETFAALNF